MIKLPRNVKGKEFLTILYRLGFREIGRKGSHVRLKHRDGRWTQVAIHPKPIPHGTLRAILRQADISLAEFLKLL